MTNFYEEDVSVRGLLVGLFFPLIASVGFCLLVISYADQQRKAAKAAQIAPECSK